jgi:hypothetical protein
MNQHFPILEHLSLWFATANAPTLLLPKGFLAPNLLHLDLPGIFPIRRLRFLTSTVSLITLVLWNIETSSYFRPRVLVARLSSLPQLEELAIGFSIPIPRPSTERELLGEQGTPVTLPNLKSLAFRGVSAYLEYFIAQIRAPALEQLSITLFNQIAFTLPHMSHLINTTEGLKTPTMNIVFGHNAVSISTANSFPSSDGFFFLQVMCKPLDWQIDCATQLCGTLTPALLVSNVWRLTLVVNHHYDTSHDLTMPVMPLAPSWTSQMSPATWLHSEIDETMWHELLRSFIGVKELRIHGNSSEVLARTLQLEEVGSDPGLLPDLQEIVAARNLFASFIDARRVVGRPVQFSPPSVGPGLRLAPLRISTL